MKDEGGHEDGEEVEQDEEGRGMGRLQHIPVVPVDPKYTRNEKRMEDV